LIVIYQPLLLVEFVYLTTHTLRSSLQFVLRRRIQSTKLLSQGFLKNRLIFSVKTFFGINQHLVEKYSVICVHMTKDGIGLGWTGFYIYYYVCVQIGRYIQVHIIDMNPDLLYISWRIGGTKLFSSVDFLKCQNPGGSLAVIWCLLSPFLNISINDKIYKKSDGMLISIEILA